jgi:hypothetical protein
VVSRPGGSKSRRGVQDAEVFIVKETKDNSGVFRGYIRTQPGSGSEVLGTLELMPGREVRLGYVDLGNSRGRKNVVYELKLPVVSAIMRSSVAAAQR